MVIYLESQRVLQINEVNTRGSLLPEPRYDAISSIFFTIQEKTRSSEDDSGDGMFSGFLVVEDEFDENHSKYGLSGAFFEISKSEADMILRFAAIVRDIDPDIILGFEIQKASWGYLIERAAKAYGIRTEF